MLLTPIKPAPQPHAPQTDARRITSAALLAGHRKVQIEHEGHVYTLHLTRQGKLLLTK